VPEYGRSTPNSPNAETTINAERAEVAETTINAERAEVAELLIFGDCHRER
jgi:hypothetical protein